MLKQKNKNTQLSILLIHKSILKSVKYCKDGKLADIQNYFL